MAQAVFDSPIREVKGEQVNVDANTAGYCALEPGFHEVILNCPDEDWKLLLNPIIECVLIYNGTAYTDYTSQSRDKSASTHVPLDALNGAAGKILYVGAPEKFGGIYFDIGTAIGNTAATMDWEYSSDAVNYTDFASSETDGTNGGGGPFGTDGAITWSAVPTGWAKASVGGRGGGDLYWARVKTSAALNATVDVNEMLTVNKNVNYGYFDKGEDYRFSLNTQRVGALQMVTAANATNVNVTWLKH